MNFSCRVIRTSSSLSYPYWVVSFGGPIVIIAAVIQAAFQRPYSIFAGAIVSEVTCFVVNALYFVYMHVAHLRPPKYKYNQMCLLIYTTTTTTTTTTIHCSGHLIMINHSQTPCKLADAF